MIVGLVFVALFGGFTHAQEKTASLKTGEKTGAGPSSNGERSATTRQTPSPAPGEELLDDPAFKDAPHATRNPTLALPFGKLIFVIVSWLFWLRILHLCRQECRDCELNGRRWTQTLFTVGLVGMLIALFLPAYLLAAALVLPGLVVMFEMFRRWRNKTVPAAIPAMSWSALLTRHSTFYKPTRRAEGSGPPASQRNGAPEDMDDEAVPDVVVLGTSLTTRDHDERLGDHARNSLGFRSALRLVEQSVTRRATDLHLHPNDGAITVRMRIDGELREVESLDFDNGLSVINVIKILADMNIADRRRSQDGSFRADVQGRRLSFRVSSQGVQTGEKLSIRILDPAQHLATFWTLGLPQTEYEKLAVVLQRSQGMVLFAGATGAGKSTSAYAAIRTLDAKSRNIVTVEDPIEYQIPDVDQIEVNVKAGQTFQSALRSLLRHDTDVVMIGEIRDEETAQIACQAATTGQLVISTLHANDTVTGLFRLNELDVEPYITASAVRSVMSQQLVRLLCPQCRVAHRPSDKVREEMGLGEIDSATVFRAMDPNVNSCLTCNGRGYLGRIGVFEYLEVTPEIRTMIREKADGNAIRRVALEQGMTPMWDNGLRLVKQGIVSIEELQRFIERPS